MSEENTSANAPSPTSNQNLIIGLILGSMVLLLFLLVLNMQGGKSGASSSEINELKALVEGKRTQLDLERQRLGLSPLGVDGTGVSIEALATKISTDSSYLASLSTALQNALEEKTSRATAAEASLKSLYSQVDELERQLNDARAKAAESGRLQQEVANLRSQLESERKRIAELNAQLANAPSQAALADLQNRLEQALSDRDSISEQYKLLQERTRGMVDGDQLAALRDRIKELEPENNKLRYEVQRLQALLDRTRLFVESSEDLAPIAQRLYRELSTLDSVASVAELNGEYDRINSEFNASVVDTVAFAEGSSRIDFDKAEEIRRLVSKTSPNAFFLVVGYASTTGGIDLNRKLSSDRSSRIASVVNSYKGETQEIQAVFLGQTNRFSTSDPARNQICEVWEIRKK